MPRIHAAIMLNYVPLHNRDNLFQTIERSVLHSFPICAIKICEATKFITQAFRVFRQKGRYSDAYFPVKLVNNAAHSLAGTDNKLSFRQFLCSHQTIIFGPTLRKPTST